MRNWQQIEGFRREVHPYSLADRMRHGGAPAAVAAPTHANEWRQLREAVQPGLIVVGASPETWAVNPDTIEEDDGGTFYTDWIELEDGPVARGYFGLPECEVVSVLDEGETESNVTVDAEFYDEDTETETVRLATLWSDGDATRSGAGGVLFQLSGGKVIEKVRFKVVSGAGVVWTLNGATLTLYARS